jgi:hemolysin activation/secretion protein
MLKKLLTLYFSFYLVFSSAFSQATPTPNPEANTPAPKSSKKPKAKNCIKLKIIDIDEYQLFTLEKQQSLLNSHLGSCIDAKLIKTLMTQIGNFYTNQGYITTKPYLKPQDINNGKVKINVITGLVENIVNGKTQKTDNKIATAFLSQKSKPLNLRDIETALEMINRVPSVDAKFKIKPGKQKSASIIEVNISESSPYHFSFGMGGEGDLKDDNPDLNAVFSVDNLFDMNDILSITINGSTLQQQYQSTKGREANYALPMGSYLLNFIYADTSYNQGVAGIDETYLASGDTKSNRLKISKMLTRDKRNKYQVLLSIYHKDTKNYFSDEPIDVSSYKTTLVQVDFIHTYLQNWGQLNNTYSYYQGVDWFGARDDDYISAETDATDFARLEFKKSSFASNLLYYFQAKKYSLNSSFHLQHTQDILYDNDKLIVGSSATVRGYGDSNLFGNNAWYVKNDLAKPIELNLDAKKLKIISPFIGFDYGNVKCESDNIDSCGKISSGSIGFKTSGDNLGADFTWSYPLKNITQDFKKESLFTFNANWTF